MFFNNALKGKNEWYLYLATVLLVIVGYIIGQFPMTLVQLSRINNNPDIGMETLEQFANEPDFSLFGIGNNLGLILMIAIFIFAMLALWLAVKYIHKKRLIDLITTSNKIDWNRIGFSFGLWFGLTLIFELISYFIDPLNYTIELDWSAFIPLLLICLFLLPIQTTFEELFFRGFMLQGFGLWFKNKWGPLLITSLLFGAVHGMNPEIEKFGVWTMQAYYISAGLFLGIITIMDNRLELAIGVHAATNIYGAAIFSYDGSVIQTDSIFRSTEINAELMLVFFWAISVIFYLICSKKYNWPGIKTLLDPVSFNNSESEETVLL